LRSSTRPRSFSRSNTSSFTHPASLQLHAPASTSPARFEESNAHHGPHLDPRSSKQLQHHASKKWQKAVQHSSGTIQQLRGASSKQRDSWVQQAKGSFSLEQQQPWGGLHFILVARLDGRLRVRAGALGPAATWERRERGASFWF
ncbi:hypothetical protein VIGAN_01212900, partial [Vigna angularis var. angularis]